MQSKRAVFGLAPDPVNTLKDRARPNRRVTADELRAILTSGIYPPIYDELPGLARRAYCDGDTAAIERLRAAKLLLPYFISGGFCPVHHNDETLEYNGRKQIDIDFKFKGGDIEALALLERIKTLRIPGVIIATLSPSTYGVKMLLATNNEDITRHAAALKFAVSFLSEVLEVEKKYFDTLGASQPVYLPYERTPGTLVYNSDPGVFQIPTEALQLPTGEQTGDVPAVTYGSDTISAAAEYLATNRIEVATCYAEYLRIMFAVHHAFNLDGETLALALLNNCPNFLQSATRANFSQRYRSIKHDKAKLVTGNSLVWLAQVNGWTIEQQAPQRKFKGKPGEYLTDVLTRYGVDLNDVFGKYIVSPTGSGKTNLAAILSGQPGRKIVLVVPTKALLKRICKRHEKEGAVPFFGGIQNRQLPDGVRFIVSTVQSFKALGTRVALQQFDVILDESHGLTADTSRGYKLADLRYFYNNAKQFARSLTFLTGTPLFNFHPDFAEIERWTITTPQQREKSVYIIDCGNIAATTAQYFRESVAAGRFPVVLLNDKYLKLAALTAALKGYNFAILNSSKKEDQVFETIAANAKIPDGIEGIITTVVLKEGNDINDQRRFDFIIVGQHHHSTIEQISARARTAADISVYILKGKDRKKSDRNFVPSMYARLAIERAQRFCDEHNAQTSTDDTTALYHELSARLAIQTAAVHEDNGRLDVCYFAINNEVYTAETFAEYANDQLQIKALEQYGFTYLESVTNTANDQHSDELAAKIAQAKEATKEQRKEAYTANLETLKSAVNPATIIRDAENKTVVPAAFKHVATLVKNFRLNHRDAIDILTGGDGGGRAFKLLVNQLRIETLRTNGDYMKSGRLFSLILLKLKKELRPGTKYTAAEIRDKMTAALALDKSIDLHFLQPDKDDSDAIGKANRKSVDLLRMFYRVTNAGKTAAIPGDPCPRKSVFILETHGYFHGQKNPTISDPATAEKTLLAALAAGY